jgi:putative tricarboxylic transport membrane protein
MRLARDRWAAAVLLLFGLAGAVEAGRLSIGAPGRPGPGFFPFSIAVALSLVALALLVRPPRRGGPGAETEPSEPLRRGRAAWTLLTGVAYALFLEPLGFLLSTAGFLLILLSAIGPQRPAVAVVMAVMTSVLTYLLFKAWLGVQLPAGLLGL